MMFQADLIDPPDSDPANNQGRTCPVKLLLRSRCLSIPHRVTCFSYFSFSYSGLQKGWGKTLITHGFVVAWTWRMQAAGRGMLVASLEMEDLLVQPLWKTVWQFLRKLKIELLYNWPIPLLSIFTKEMRSLLKKYLHPHPPVQPLPPTPSTKKKEFLPFVMSGWTLRSLCKVEWVSQTTVWSDRQTLYDLTYVWNLEELASCWNTPDHIEKSCSYWRLLFPGAVSLVGERR